jgi:hypothetical protein
MTEDKVKALFLLADIKVLKLWVWVDGISIIVERK